MEEERRRKNYIAALKTTAPPVLLSISLPRRYLSLSLRSRVREDWGVGLSGANKEENRGGGATTQEQYEHIRGKKRTGLQLGDNLNTKEAKWKWDEKREEGSLRRAASSSSFSLTRKQKQAPFGLQYPE